MTGAVVLSDLLKGILVISSHWGNIHWKLFIYTATYVTVLLHEVVVNMLQSLELGLHAESLGNY